MNYTGTIFFSWPLTSITSITGGSSFAYYPLGYYQAGGLVVPVAPKPVPNPYASDPDQRHLARIRRELEAPWAPSARKG